jgi:hypothetical protein
MDSSSEKFASATSESAAPAPQFTMAALMLVVTVVAVLVAVLRLIGPEGEPLMMFVLGALPTMAVWTAGIVLALRRWHLHPRVSLYALVAMVLLVMLRIFGGLITPWLFSFARAQSVPPQDLMALYSFFSSCIAAVAFGLLLLAIFGRRH